MFWNGSIRPCCRFSCLEHSKWVPWLGEKLDGDVVSLTTTWRGDLVDRREEGREALVGGAMRPAVARATRPRSLATYARPEATGHAVVSVLHELGLRDLLCQNRLACAKDEVGYCKCWAL